MEKKFDHILKPFLAEKLKNHLIPVHTIFDIVHEAATKYDQANTDKEIDIVLYDLSQHFTSLHELAEKFHYQHIGLEQKDLEREVGDVIASLLPHDMENALKIMHFVRDNKITSEVLHQKFPEHF